MMDNTRDDQGAETPEEVPADVAALRQQIDETRAEMSETIEAIEEKLAVERLTSQMQAAVRAATIGKVQETSARLRTRGAQLGGRLPTLVAQHPRVVAGVGSSLLGGVVVQRLVARQQSVMAPPAAEGASAPQMAGSMQAVAQQNLLTLTALTTSAVLTVVARLLDRRRTQAPPELPDGPAPTRWPFLGAVITLPLGAGAAWWWLRGRQSEPTTAQDLLLAWLNDAYSMETALIRTLQQHARDAQDHPQIKDRLDQHLEETRHHAELVKSCIERLGGSTSSVKALLGSVMGTVPTRSTGGAPDQLLKNALADAAAESLEVAAYTALVAAAQELDDDFTAAVCRQLLQEDEDMARWIVDTLPMLTRETLAVRNDDGTPR